MTGIYRTEQAAREARARYQELLEQWPVASEHLRVPTRQGETFVVACGPEDAPPLLLFQGSGANAAMWMGDVAAWAAHFRVYAVDLIGEPGLSAPSRPPLESAAYAHWLDDVFQALNLTRASLVGVSLGGWLAIDYAARRRERVERLVLLCPSGVGRQRKSFAWKALPLLLLGRRGRRKLLQMLAGGTAADPAADRRMAAFMSLVWRSFRPRRARVPIHGDEVLRRLTMPVLVIAGGRDPMLDSRDTRRRVERLLPRVTVRFVPDAGHFLGRQTMPILEFLLGSVGCPALDEVRGGGITVG